MRLLIDTNIFLRHYKADGIPESWSAAIDEADQVFFSTVSMWEIAIKYSRGKLPISEGPEAFVSGGMTTLQLMPLDIEPRHALATAALPMHHTDPFDRLLIAQALCERLTLMTTDRKLREYDVPIFGGTKRKAKG